MKKILLIFALGLCLSACGNKADKTQDETRVASQFFKKISKADRKAFDKFKKDVYGMESVPEDSSDQVALKEDDIFFSDFNLVS